MEENLKKMIEGYEKTEKKKVAQIIINMPELRKQMKRRKSRRAKRK